MSVFNIYAKYYNLLYRDKDYKAEVEYINDLIKKNKPDAATILNLGCGTGRHDFLLIEKGYSVTGVDFSKEMLSIANESLARLSPKDSNLKFIYGNIQSVQLEQSFDAVISLFHVMSYQITNEMLYSTFRNVRAHLKEHGVFIFDFWYGPAVLSEKPTIREKKLEDEELIVHRIATPVMHPNDNTVDVNIEVFLTDKITGTTEKIYEKHRMRYLFLPELKYLLESLGFNIIGAFEWMSIEKQMGFNSWNGVLVVKK